MELVELRKENIEEFKKLMQDAFQYGYESIYGEDKEQVLPDKDIDEKTNHNHLDFLFVKVGVQSKGIGQTIWKE